MNKFTYVLLYGLLIYVIDINLKLKFDFGSDEGWAQFDEFLKERSYVDG